MSSPGHFARGRYAPTVTERGSNEPGDSSSGRPSSSSGRPSEPSGRPSDRPSNRPSEGGVETSRRQSWILGALILGLLAVCFYLFAGEGEDDWGEPTDLGAERGDVRSSPGPATIGSPDEETGGADDEAVARPEPPAPPPLDREQLAELLLDGGQLSPEDELVLSPTLPPSARPSSDVSPADPSLPTAPTAPVRIGPTSPEAARDRAVFWRDLMEHRVATLQREVEEAAVSGDEARVARARRQIERLEAQRPAMEQRVQELQAAAPEER